MIGAFDMHLTKKLANGYKMANKKRKGEILTEYCSLTEVSRNTASKRFQKEIREVYPRVFPRRDKLRKRGPKRKSKGPDLLFISLGGSSTIII